MRIFKRLVGQGIRDLALTPWTQFLTLTAVTMVSFLAGLFLMTLSTLDHQMATAKGEVAFQVFWKADADMDIISTQWKEIGRMPGIKNIQTFTPDEAMQSLTESVNNDGTSTTLLTDWRSPLPPTALLNFISPMADTPEARSIAEDSVFYERTQAILKNLPSVDKVVGIPLREEMGQAWKTMSRYIMWPGILLLGLILSLVVGNTIRLSLIARANEVEILQLVGAHNWYIRLPLVVGGIVQGFVGGVLALLLLRLVHFQIHQVLNFPPLMLEIQFLPLRYCAVLVLLPACMGAFGSWIAVRKEY